MRKKLLRTYTFLGLMLGSLVTPGQAGEYEDAFIEEMNRGAGQLHCRKGPDKGSKPDTISKYECVSLGVRTKTSYPAAGFANARVRTTHLTEWRWVEYPSVTKPIFDCLGCGGRMDGDTWKCPGEGTYPICSFSSTSTMDTLTLTAPSGCDPERMTGCCSKPWVVGKLKEVCDRAPPLTFLTDDWRRTLINLWYAALVLDKETMIRPTEKGPGNPIRVIYGHDALISRCILL